MTDASRYPQAKQMADESMVRNLAAQILAIWPQEQKLFSRYRLPRGPRILDLGCGTGELASRLGPLYAQSTVVGVDVIQEHLVTAGERQVEGTRRLWVRADGGQVPFADASFDLSVVRHVIQSIPNAMDLLKEMVRVTRSGGRLHVLAEDYGMMHFHPVDQDIDAFWREGPAAFAQSTGSDLLSGRKAYTMLTDLGLNGITVDYVTVDTQRVPRDIFASIWEAWRDGYTDAIAEHTRFSRDEVLSCFQTTIEAIRSPRGYGVWQIPVVSGVVP